jgi:hypothetical protein
MPPKTLETKTRGESTFTAVYTQEEIEKLILDDFKSTYHATVAGFDLDLYFDPDGTITISCHKEIK